MSKKKAMFFKQVDAGVVDLYDFDDVASLQSENDVLNTNAILGVADWANITSAHTITIAGVGKADTEHYSGNGNTLCLKAELIADGNFRRIEFGLEQMSGIASVIAGDQYTISFYAKCGAVNAQQISGWTNCTGDPVNVALTTTWTLYSYTITAETTADIVIRFYGSWSGGLAGDTFYLDDFSIIKI